MHSVLAENVREALFFIELGEQKRRAITVLYYCFMMGIQIEGFVSVQKVNRATICGYSVFYQEDLERKYKEKSKIVLLYEDKKYYLKDIMYCNINDIIIGRVEEFLDKDARYPLFDPRFVLMNLYRQSRNKKIIIHGFKESLYYTIITKCLECMNIPYVFSTVGEGPLTNLLYKKEEESSDFYILCGDYEWQNRMFYDVGVKGGAAPYRDFIGLRPFNLMGIESRRLEFDAQLTWTFCHHPENKNGFVRFTSGCDTGKEYRVVVLGDSLTDEGFNLGDSWVKKLSEMYEGKKKLVVYNGAIEGFTIQQMLLKLIRDVPVLRPNLVITAFSVTNYTHSFMEGYAFEDCLVERYMGEFLDLWNDRHHRNRMMLYGNKEDIAQREMIIRCLRMMAGVSTSIGAKFHAVALPNITCKSVYSEFEELCVLDEWESGLGNDVLSFREVGKKIEDMGAGFTNLERAFDSEEDIFVDICHYKTYGEDLLASTLYPHLVEYIF